MITADKIIDEKKLAKFLRYLEKEKDRSLAYIQTKPMLKNPSETRNIIDYYFFAILANTGLRVSELINSEIEDIGLDYIKIKKEFSKNKKDGTVFFGKKTQSLIEEYIKFRNENISCDSRNIFYSKSSRNNKMSRSYFHIRFKMWLKKVGLPEHYSVHSLRHSYGTYCLDQGLSLTFVRDQLRHSSISITSTYLHLTKENREKVKDIF